MEGIAHLCSLFYGALEHTSGIAFKRLSVHRIHIAEHTGNLSALGSPGQYHPGIGIGIKIHIRLTQSFKSVYGGAVKHDLIIERLLKLACRDSHILKIPENIGKLQTDEFNVLFLCKCQYLFLCVFHKPFLS